MCLGDVASVCSNWDLLVNSTFSPLLDPRQLDRDWLCKPAELIGYRCAEEEEEATTRLPEASAPDAGKGKSRRPSRAVSMWPRHCCAKLAGFSCDAGRARLPLPGSAPQDTARRLFCSGMAISKVAGGFRPLSWDFVQKRHASLLPLLSNQLKR